MQRTIPLFSCVLLAGAASAATVTAQRAPMRASTVSVDGAYRLVLEEGRLVSIESRREGGCLVRVDSASVIVVADHWHRYYVTSRTCGGATAVKEPERESGTIRRVADTLYFQVRRPADGLVYSWNRFVTNGDTLRSVFTDDVGGLSAVYVRWRK